MVRQSMLNRLGRDFAPDERDKKFRIGRIVTARKKRVWDDTWWRGDQGNEPSCVGYAWAHWLAAAPIRQLVQPDGLYRLAQYLDEWQGVNYDGTSVRAGAKVLQWLGMIREYRWAWNANQALPSILEHGPMVIGVDWHEDMFEVDAKGYIHATGPVLGGHAVLVRAVNLNKEYVQITNSWEKDWGRNGRAYLSIKDFDKLLRANGEACRAIEKKPRSK